MDEFLCLTLLSRPGESEADFKARLSHFWTHMLRNFQADFEKVYAEMTAFEMEGDCRARKYLIQEEVVEILQRELTTAGLDFTAIDPADCYTKYEAVAPEWMQIEH